MTGAAAGITRRGLVGLAAAVALPVPKADRLAFDVYRNGSRIGRQVLTFHRSGPALTVETDVKLHVSVVGIRLFHYTGRIVEHWHGETFRSAESHINDNGTRHAVTAKREAQGIAVSGDRIKPYVAPPDALPLTYWNKQVLSGPMINLQTGHTDRPTVTAKGWFKWPAVPSGDVVAREYKLSGALKLAIYYDRAGRWSGLSFHHRGHITYRPVLDAS
jgi:hypothetical protein